MEKIIIAPDSFKGTLSANEVCDIISKAVKDTRPEAETFCIPMSDGGEGMVNSYLNLIGGELCSAEVTGPRGLKVSCPYGILPDGTVVAEMAGCAGLTLMEGHLEPLTATTYGLGELFRHIEAQGFKKLLLGIGGSATNDCGIGMAAALGYKFYDSAGNLLVPTAKNLHLVSSITVPEKPLNFEISVACDVNNPLCGKNGATYVFGPQKGVKPEEREFLDKSFESFSAVMAKALGREVSMLSGAGAAGGMGAALVAFCGAKLYPGIEMFLDSAGFDGKACGAKLIITGEGRLDAQSMSGKVPVGVGRRAKKAGTDCIAICGCLGDGAEAVLSEGIKAFYPCSEAGRSLEQIKLSCREDLYKTAIKALKEYFR